ncbi:hypothetical protein HGRIS_002447 [Hohenbuehelia grisea]|uniref:FCP1 homology domain-containing protein n=1 Tax=Hohenbuehelia grisea TaxID=104357 RepID=A0ABR3JKZ6_9AGAR
MGEQPQRNIGQDPTMTSSSSSPTAPTNTAAPNGNSLAAASDNEQASVNATLAPSRKRVPFYRRRANKASASEGASEETAQSILKVPRRTRAKPSLFSRVVNKVVSCVHDPSPSDPVLCHEQEPTTTTTATVTDTQHPPLALREFPPQEDSPMQIDTAIPRIPDEDEALARLTPVPHDPPLPPSADEDVILQPPPSTHLLPQEDTDGLTSGAVQPPGATALQVAKLHAPDSEESDSTKVADEDADDHAMMDELAEEERLIRNGGAGIPMGPDGVPRPLLPPIAPEHAGRKCLVLDLDETLVHSSFRAVQQADFIVPVEIEYHWHHFHVLKRPGVDNFLKRMGELYEIVVFTASLAKYADPVLDKLDIHQVVAHRLFRESCYHHKGNYVKDLSQLGRPIADTIILDNSPASYIFHPNNAAPVSSWFNDPHDAELTDLIPFLADLTNVPDVRGVLDSNV